MSDIAVKWSRRFSPGTLLLLSTGLTLAFSLPSALVLFMQPSRKNFKTCLFLVSMTFFFYSFHVHEKTILLPLMPLLINFSIMKYFIVDFSLVATFICFALLREDGILIQYFAVLAIYWWFGS